MNSLVKTLQFTLDRRIDSVLLKVGYSIEASAEDGLPMTVRIIWINPANIRRTITEDEWDVIHAYILREESQHLKRAAGKLKVDYEEKRSSLDPYL